MAARGNFNFPALPKYQMAAGLQTEFGVITPPAGRVAAYVRSTGVQSGDDKNVTSRLFLTLNAGLAECRPGMGDVVMVLPGHTESIATADAMSNLVAGTKIVGIGRGSIMPKLTWTAAAATFLLDQANCSIEGMRLNTSPDSGTVTVAAPITVSATGCAITNCEFRTSVSATSLSTIPLTTTAAASDFEFSGNLMLGATAGACTTGIRFVGADRLRFTNNFVSVATSGVAVGAVQFLTTASTDIQMLYNYLQNRLASSTHALTGMAGLTGFVDHLDMLVNTGIAGANTVTNLHFGRQVYCGNPGTRAALALVESA